LEPFKTHTGKIAVLDWNDVNTDLIIPARYLKRIERTGYGPLLFADKRYVPGGAPSPDQPERHGGYAPDFPLNDPKYQGATILAVGSNFGCGSSREHAVWAVQQAGFRVLIAPGKDEGFANIFMGNAYNNGLLPIELPRETWSRLVEAGNAPGGAWATVDLENRSVTLFRDDPAAEPGRSAADGGPLAFPFDIPEANRHRLLQGLDAISETLLHDDAIVAYERSAPAWAAGPA
jgi:3-isopropylmalate/(R)-2-methylmalate dehydratase small subunit